MIKREANALNEFFPSVPVIHCINVFESSKIVSRQENAIVNARVIIISRRI
ncbi:MAG: hypothetical protein AABX80_02685 [Nanoarchaeota archaeon]